jgi:hypothetical protein
VKVEYRGPHESVEVPLADGGNVVVRRGEAVEVPDAIAKGLLVQGTWKADKGEAEEPVAEKPTPKASKAGKDGK